MLRIGALAAGLALVACAVAAQDLSGEPLTGEAFGQEVEGWTLDFDSGGVPAGREQYFPGGTVLWENGAGQCLHGRWLAIDELICFSYEDDPDDLRCWDVLRSEEGVIAVSPEGSALRESRRSQENLTCPGPALGV